MPLKGASSDLPTQSFTSAAEFEEFLEREHETSPGLHLKLAKKSSGIPSISGAEAVEVALCFGWIDGQANGLDDKWWTVRYTPRRVKSIWSQKNVDTVARLTNDARMRPAGLAAVDAAKADGRWARAYAGPATITIPEDLTAALASVPAADAFFSSLNKSDRYSVLWRIETASVNSRPKRVEAVVQMLATGSVPGAAAKELAKTKKAVSGKKKVVGSEITKPVAAKEKPAKIQMKSKVQTELPRREGLRKRPG